MFSFSIYLHNAHNLYLQKSVIFNEPLSAVLFVHFSFRIWTTLSLVSSLFFEAFSKIYGFIALLVAVVPNIDTNPLNSLFAAFPFFYCFYSKLRLSNHSSSFHHYISYFNHFTPNKPKMPQVHSVLQAVKVTTENMKGCRDDKI